MTKIYITRHGETQFNAEVKAQGWVDSPLTSVGIENAEALKRRLDNVDIDVIYTSPLGRAKTTAEILRGNRPIQIIQDDRLKEYRYGIIDGKPYEDGKQIGAVEPFGLVPEDFPYIVDGIGFAYDSQFVSDLQPEVRRSKQVYTGPVDACDVYPVQIAKTQ